MATIAKRTRSQNAVPESAATSTPRSITTKKPRVSPKAPDTSVAPDASVVPDAPKDYTISDEMVTLVYNDVTPKAESEHFAETPTDSSSSAESASPSAGVATMSKDKLEDNRKKLYAVITEYGEKLSLLGVTVKKYGPGTMKPLAYKLEKKGYGSKNKNAEPVEGAAEGGAPTPKVLSKIKTRKLTNKTDYFEPKIISQTNEKQRREARMLLKLFDKLDMDNHCNGKQLKDDIVDNQHTPYRYIYLFLKTIGDAQYVVGFISATRDSSNHSHAVLDYVCPNVTVPTDTIWKESEMKHNFAAYVVLNFLWLNNATGNAPRYEKVKYEDEYFSNAKEVFRNKKLKTFPHINTYAATIMNFKT
jgi:hypothetical protein